MTETKNYPSPVLTRLHMTSGVVYTVNVVQIINRGNGYLGFVDPEGFERNVWWGDVEMVVEV